MSENTGSTELRQDEKNEAKNKAGMIKKSNLSDDIPNPRPNNQKSYENETSIENKAEIYTVSYNGNKKIINMPMVDHSADLVMSISAYLESFVRIKDYTEYDDNQITFSDKNIIVEDSLPLVKYKEKYYAFKNMDELEKFYNGNNHKINSFTFYQKEYDARESLDHNEISEYAREFFLFDISLKVQLAPIEMEFYINDDNEKKTVKIKIEAEYSENEENIFKKIKEKIYGGKEFVKLKFNDDKRKIDAYIMFKGKDTDIIDEYQLRSPHITVKDFILDLEKKYNTTKLSIESSPDLKSELIEINNNSNPLVIVQLKLYKLEFKDHDPVCVGNNNNIEQVLEKIDQKNYDHIFFLIDNKLIINKNKFAYKYVGKEISLFNLLKTPITITLRQNNHNFKNITLRNPDDLKGINQNCISKIIESTGIKRKAKDIKIKYNSNEISANQKLFEHVEIHSEGCIYLDIDFNKVDFSFKIKYLDREVTQKLSTEKVDDLKDVCKCDKIVLFQETIEKDNKTSFLYIDPDKECDIIIFDKYYFVISGQSNPFSLFLPRYQTYLEAIRNSENYAKIPYVVYNKEVDISEKQVSEIKNNEKDPFTLKIKYDFKRSDIDDIISYIIDDPEEKVKKYAAKCLGLAEGGISKVKAEFRGKEITNDDTFGSLDYEIGDFIIVEKLPPNLNFTFEFKDLENILIGPTVPNDLPKEGFKEIFDKEKTTLDVKNYIRQKFNIQNEIKLTFSTKQKIMEDKSLVYDLADNEMITISILQPTYKFISPEGGAVDFSLNANITIGELKKDQDFRAKINIKADHDVKLIFGEEELEDEKKISDYYRKGDIKYEDLDPVYYFKYKEEPPIFTRFPDDTEFDVIRKYVKKKIESLKSIQRSRIDFYLGNQKCKEPLNAECNRENNHLTIKLDKPEYTFQFEKKKPIKRHFEENATVKDVIPKLEGDLKKLLKVEKLNFDIKLSTKDRKLHESNLVLYDIEKLYKKDIYIKKCPIRFLFNINNSEENSYVRFHIQKDDKSDEPFDSAKISLKTLIAKKLIKLDENLKDFTLLEKNAEDDILPIPPVERFRITTEDGEERGSDEPFFDIINGDRTKIINIELLPPKFTFTLQNGIKSARISVKRGKKVSEIRPKLIKKFKLQKYDLDIIPKKKISTDKKAPSHIKEGDDDDGKEEDESVMKDDSNFDAYEQIINDQFIVVTKNPLYNFKIKRGDKFSGFQKFSFDPNSPVRVVKSIVLPFTKAKRLSIYGPFHNAEEEKYDDNEKLIEDMENLPETYTENKESYYVIVINDMKISIKKPSFDEEEEEKEVELMIKPKSTVEEIETLLSEKIASKSVSLYLFNTKLDPKMHYEDLIITKKAKIECRYTFTLHFEKDESLNCIEVLDDKLTVLDCRKKCLEIINSKNKVKNLKRVQLKIGENELEFENNNDTIYAHMKEHKEFKQIDVLLKEDEMFNGIDENDENIKDFQNTLPLESNVGEIRKDCEKNFIIKLEKNESTVFDDQPLFTIQNEKIVTEVAKETKTKMISVKIPKGLDVVVKKENDQKFERKITYKAATVKDLKEIIKDKYLHQNVDLAKGISIVLPITDYEEKEEDKNDPIISEFPYINYKNGEIKGRILCDSQNLFTINANEFILVENRVVTAENTIHVNYLKEKYDIPYNEETKVSDIFTYLKIKEDEEEEPSLIYLGQFLHKDKLLKDIIVGNNHNFYCSMVKTLSDI